LRGLGAVQAFELDTETERLLVTDGQFFSAHWVGLSAVCGWVTGD
jgi:hypothetical protein